ncbi:MAG: hypothetical protein DI565_06540 [Ancylobacter novellus]|uniref:Uncharacterized protein n=1 Tax=Ancylobacter novellus TaxID=921 RepID=A0A2W5KNK6_ANCNO|nr:MAG: hypothetical protein DI565_06540 [Ancylobacter novellus]
MGALFSRTAFGLGFAAALAASSASAEEYVFLAAPQTDLNRMFRVETTTGEVGVCQYAVKEGAVGVTLCLQPGEGAGAQEPGLYGLAASNHAQEGGVYRVERRTGRMSACYVLGEQVVCTPQAR